jgi:hypothetical protein
MASESHGGNSNRGPARHCSSRAAGSVDVFQSGPWSSAPHRRPHGRTIGIAAAAAVGAGQFLGRELSTGCRAGNARHYARDGGRRGLRRLGQWAALQLEGVQTTAAAWVIASLQLVFSEHWFSYFCTGLWCVTLPGMFILQSLRATRRNYFGVPVFCRNAAILLGFVLVMTFWTSDRMQSSMHAPLRVLHLAVKDAVPGWRKALRMPGAQRQADCRTRQPTTQNPQPPPSPLRQLRLFSVESAPPIPQPDKSISPRAWDDSGGLRQDREQSFVAPWPR